MLEVQVSESCILIWFITILYLIVWGSGLGCLGQYLNVFLPVSDLCSYDTEEFLMDPYLDLFYSPFRAHHLSSYHCYADDVEFHVLYMKPRTFSNLGTLHSCHIWRSVPGCWITTNLKSVSVRSNIGLSGHQLCSTQSSRLVLTELSLIWL